MGVELDGELLLDEPQRITGRSVDLRNAAERQWILEKSWSLGLPECASLEEVAKAGQRLANSRVRTGLTDDRMERSDVAAEAFEVQRGRCVERLQQRARVRDCESCLPRRERIRHEEGTCFTGRELEVAEDAVRKIRVLSEIGLSERPERSNFRDAVLVQGVHDELRELGPRSLVAGHEAVGQPQERGPHHVLGGSLAEPDAVAGDCRAIERGELGAFDPCVPAHADSGRHAVDRGAVGHGLLDHLASLAHLVEGARHDLDALACARDAYDLVERQSRSRERDRHERTLRPLRIGRAHPGNGAVVDLGRALDRQPLPLPGHEAADDIRRPVKADLLERRGREDRRVAVRTHEHEPLVEAKDVGIPVRGVRVWIEAPLEHRARNVECPGDDSVSGALVVRARVDQERTGSLCRERLLRFEAFQPAARFPHEVVDCLSAHLLLPGRMCCSEYGASACVAIRIQPPALPRRACLRSAVFAGAAKHDVVGCDGVAAPVCDSLDRCFERGVLERLDLAAVVADEMVVMVPIGMRGLEASDSVAEVDALDEPESVEPFEGAVHARDTDLGSRGAEALVDLLRREATALAPEELDNRAARASASPARLA